MVRAGDADRNRHPYGRIMTIVHDVPTTPAAVLDAVETLAPGIAGRAAEIEAARRLPADLLDQLKAAGVFRLILPASHGGLEADVTTGFRVLEALARADASVAWTVMIGSASWRDLVGLPRATFDSLFADGPDVAIAGVINPTGSLEPVDGGYVVTGRWSFASGCEHADWVFGDCIEGVVDGLPQLRIALFSPDQVVIEDTWDVSGLRGTGSHHFRVDGVVVPAERTLDALDESSCIDATIVHIPQLALYSCAVATVAIGVAQGALDDVLDLAVHKVPLLAGSPLATNPSFQTELAAADAELRAARALLYETAAAMWAAAAEGIEPSMSERARMRAGAVWATECAARVVGTAYRAGGGSSLYSTCPLQRRLRDVHAITQHFLVRHDTLTTAGAVLAGNEVDVMVF
jgi:alkylation response protein AidB-like acyl-CoA dehydrogenase